MKVLFQIKVIILLIFVTSNNSLFSQEVDIVVENTTSSNLYNGLAFVDSYRVLTEKNRFLNNELGYKKGSVNLNHYLYKNIDLKYDLYKDELILKPLNGSGYLGILIDKEKIINFSIEDQHFINIDYLNPNNSKKFASGFYELKYKGKSVILLVKYKKEIKELLTNTTIHYEYNLFTEIVITLDSNFYKINNKKDLIAIFPKFKKEIHSFFRNNDDLKKANSGSFYKKLFILIDNKIM